MSVRWPIVNLSKRELGTQRNEFYLACFAAVGRNGILAFSTFWKVAPFARYMLPLLINLPFFPQLRHILSRDGELEVVISKMQTSSFVQMPYSICKLLRNIEYIEGEKPINSPKELKKKRTTVCLVSVPIVSARSQMTVQWDFLWDRLVCFFFTPNDFQSSKMWESSENFPVHLFFFFSTTLLSINKGTGITIFKVRRWHSGGSFFCDNIRKYNSCSR